MGSLSTELNVPESLRPWYENGLQFVFKGSLPEPRRLEWTAKNSVSPKCQPCNQQQVTSSQLARTPCPSSKKNPEKSSGCSSPLVTGTWPAPWGDIASRISPRLQIFWTYAQLGKDLSGQADDRRRTLFQSLIGYMGLPKGAISFWPCTSWVENKIESQPELFWKGVKSHGVKFVACFGEQARSIIVPEASGSAATIYTEGVQVVMLQDPDFLKTLPPEEQQLLSISLLRLPLF